MKKKDHWEAILVSIFIYVGAGAALYQQSFDAALVVNLC
jgi:hypothetical protein